MTPVFPPQPPAAARRATALAAVRRFLRSEDGPTSVEYAVMLALILATIFGTVGVVGGTAGGLFANAKSELDAAGF
ncbi:Flp family type IVb pilin [Alienimonas californiensis]|uniref:Flp/Fap pilin component n=1 Tax=Alienimonas californiensis TaxID=2527989 RepID=A0A517P3Y1_9PLAN|nr:Flp family type IVb pilin [Alienimonas californiensis]QDT14066.1 Flp/Fap pilin component [Alienimonas californiensis]